MDELLVKYLLEEASPSERQQVELWLQEREANSRYFDGFRTIWDESRNIAATSAINEDVAWHRFQKIVDDKQHKVMAFEPERKRWSLARVAAVAVILIGGIFVTYLFNRNKDLHFESGNEVLTCNLPDGSTVTLNRHAVLDYKKDAKNNRRHVQLSGEGFFDVAPDRTQPFVIEVGDVTVKVVGTSFNVKATADKTEVSVETGIVDVSKNSNSVLLARNERAIVTSKDNSPRKLRSTDNLYNYYRSKEMVCNGTPLSHVVDMLNEAYSTNIVIANPDIKDLPLNTTIPAGATLDNILDMISGTFNVRVERGNNNIILR